MRNLVFTTLLFAFLACKGREEARKNPEPEPAQQQAITQQAPSSVPLGQAPSPTGRVPSQCPVNRKVTSDDLGQIGGAIYKAFRAALRGPEGFEEFQSAFVPDADRAHLKTQIFPRVMQHVAKYVEGPDDPTFTLCRIEQQNPQRVKVFVLSRDPQKSDPPSILVLQDGKWLIDTMTP